MGTKFYHILDLPNSIQEIFLCMLNQQHLAMNPSVMASSSEIYSAYRKHHLVVQSINDSRHSLFHNYGSKNTRTNRDFVELH